MNLPKKRCGSADAPSFCGSDCNVSGKRHPCFDDAAFCTRGRIHLPVAPACNVQCIYCLRRFDCVNESRPGVCSRVLPPKEAAERAAVYLREHPETAVVGFAGPGDPLANEETFETMELIGKTDLQPILCLSTNGLYLPESLIRLRILGVSFLTVTINSLLPETAEKLYAWVNDHGAMLYGREAAELLLERQREGVRKAVELGFTVKINTVLLDGINTEQVPGMAEAFSAWGVHRMNINSVINVTGDSFIRPVPGEKVRRLRTEASRCVPQMKACAQCRADAAGIPGTSRGREQADQI